jgi:hypothetical protein
MCVLLCSYLCTFCFLLCNFSGNVLYKSIFKKQFVNSLLIDLLLLTIKYIFTELSCRWILWFFSAYMQNRMRVTKEYAYYCSQTYFLQFITLAHWLRGCTLYQGATTTLRMHIDKNGKRL